MKKFVMATVATAALISGGQAVAAPPNALFGNDAIALWDLNASAAQFCYLAPSAQGPASEVNATVTPGPAPRSGGASQAFSDGVITLDIQDLDDDTINNAKADAAFKNSLCNVNFKLGIESKQGGLKYAGSYVPASSGFTSLVKYDFAAEMDGFSTLTVSQSAGALTTGQKLSSTSGPRYADVRFSVNVPADTVNHLIMGPYRDEVVISLNPIP